MVIPNGIPAGRARGPAAAKRRAPRWVCAPDEIAIVVVARLFPQKRQDLAIDAVARAAGRASAVARGSS